MIVPKSIVAKSALKSIPVSKKAVGIYDAVAKCEATEAISYPIQEQHLQFSYSARRVWMMPIAGEQLLRSSSSKH